MLWSRQSGDACIFLRKGRGLSPISFTLRGPPSSWAPDGPCARAARTRSAKRAFLMPGILARPSSGRQGEPVRVSSAAGVDMKGFALAAVFALVGMVVSWGLVAWASSTWTTFSDRWIFMGAFLPILGVIGGANLAARRADPSQRRSLGENAGYVALGTLCAGIGCYVAFAIVAVTWHRSEVTAGWFELLTNPSSIPALAQRRSGS